MSKSKKLITAIAIAIAALALTLGLNGCSDEEYTKKFIAPCKVDNFDGLNLPSEPNEELEQMLSSGEGAPLVKVNGQWMQFYSRAKMGWHTMLVYVRLDNTVIVVPFDYSNDRRVAIVEDAQDDSDARITYGDNEKYSCVVHIPSD